jgi:hypothetical protein
MEPPQQRARQPFQSSSPRQSLEFESLHRGGIGAENDGGRDTGEVRDGGMEPGLSAGGAPVVGVGWRLAGRSVILDAEQVRRREGALATRECARGHASTRSSGARSGNTMKKYDGLIWGYFGTVLIREVFFL